jgi:hypothetical protein
MIPLILGGIGALGKAAFGLHQLNQAKKISDKRSIYNMPNQIGQNRDMYQRLSNTTRLPGQSVLENNIGASNAANTKAIMNAAGGSSDILAALSNQNQNTNNALNDLGVRGAEFQSMNQDKLANANSEFAAYKDQEFDYNENQPYELRMARKRALEGAGYGNFETAFGDVTKLGDAVNMNGGLGLGKKRAKAAFKGTTNYW